MVVDGSRPIAEVARELDPVEGTLGNWVGIYRRAHAGNEQPLTVSERARLRQLEVENRELKTEKEFLGKPQQSCEQASGNEKYAFINAEKANYPIVNACTWLAVSRSGFYYWLAAPATEAVRHRVTLTGLIADTQ